MSSIELNVDELPEDENPMWVGDTPHAEFVGDSVNAGSSARIDAAVGAALMTTAGVVTAEVTPKADWQANTIDATKAAISLAPTLPVSPGEMSAVWAKNFLNEVYKNFKFRGDSEAH